MGTTTAPSVDHRERDASSQPTVCVGPARSLFDANPDFAHLTGYDQAELTTLSLDALLALPPEPEIAARLHHALEHHALFVGELLWRRQTGERCWIDLVLVPVPATATAPRHHQAVCRDVTARRVAAAAAPGDRVARDRAVLDAIEAGIVVHQANTEILYANPKAAEMLGLTHDAMLGALNTDPRWRFLDEDRQPLTLDKFPVVRALTTRQVVRQVLIGSEHPDHGHVTWGMCNAHPLLDERGEITEVVVTFSDVTALKQTELAREKSEERLRLVLQGSDDAPWDWDLVTDQLYYAPRWWHMLGYEVDALPADAQLWARLMHPDDHDRVAAQLRAWLDGDASQYQIEFRLQHQAGGYVTVLSRGFVKRDAAGKAVRVSGTNTDITARRALEEKLRQSQKMEAVGQLAGGVAHDFNNLLSIILGNLDLVRHHLGDGADARESLGHAVAACRRGAELTRRLLSFSRQQPLAHEAVELGALLPGLGTVLRRLIPESIHIDVRLAADLPRVVIDPAMLENALLNLAINARDAMPTGGTLTFSAAAEDGRVRLAVSDTGTGMSPEVRERALEPFFTTKPTGQGTGLGLSMVYGFVQQSGGSLQLRSAPGEGTTVVLDLPASGAAAFVHPPEVPLPISAGPRDEVVLVVEDEPGVRRLCVQALEHLGFRTVSSADGPDALEVLAMLPRVDLLLTDVVMPGGLSGLDLAAAAQARRPDLKVIFMSGYLPDSFDPASRARIRPLLPKPFTASELSRLVSEVLGGQPRREG